MIVWNSYGKYNNMHKFKIVEKKNPLAVHGYFLSKESAEKHLKETIPQYVKLGYFMDKTLKPNDFTIAEVNDMLKPFVVIQVSGGVTDYYKSPDVMVTKFDWDDIHESDTEALLEYLEEALALSNECTAKCEIIAGIQEEIESRGK